MVDEVVENAACKVMKLFEEPTTLKPSALNVVEIEAVFALVVTMIEFVVDNAVDVATVAAPWFTSFAERVTAFVLEVANEVDSVESIVASALKPELVAVLKPAMLPEMMVSAD
jgi:hypothetical protein